MYLRMHEYTIYRSILFFFLLLLGGAFAFGANAQAETQKFFIESSYDLYGRKQIDATLVRSSPSLYFYVETSWWSARSASEKNDLQIALFELGQEFQNHIYPVLTSTFGSEPKPGIDQDERITVLIHPMIGGAGGYFRSGDVYEILQSPGSNEKEMVYLSSKYIGSNQAKSFLAHEFTHVITANQKDLQRHVSEEVWLNEARAEYAPTLLGYDDVYSGSNLERRVEHFLQKPSDSLTDWLNRQEDYGVVHMFVQYLVDYYGVQILADSLQSSRVGISSLQEALRKNGVAKDFDKIFEDWTIAVLVNDCTLGERYCYKNKHLAHLRVTPTLYVLPSAETIFSTYHTAPLWSGNWHRMVGGGENLTIQFKGANGDAFHVPYVLCDSQNTCSVEFLELDEEHKGSITFSEFSAKYSSLTLIPSVIGDRLNGAPTASSFSWEASVQKGAPQGEAALVPELLVRIAELQGQIRQLQAQLASRGQTQDSGENQMVSCASFSANLSVGARNEQVRCLQEFLKSQGPDIYPEGLVTGNFLALTKQAVIRFQEKYAPEILVPVGEMKGTGYVGQMTRNKINQLLGLLVAL